MFYGTGPLSDIVLNPFSNTSLSIYIHHQFKIYLGYVMELSVLDSYDWQENDCLKLP